MSLCFCVCVFVCPRSRPIFSKFLCMLPVAAFRYSSSGVTLCTSDYMDDVMLAHKPRLLDVAAQLKRSAHAALGVAINCAVMPVAGQRTHGTTFRAFKVTSQEQHRGGGGVCGL